MMNNLGKGLALLQVGMSIALATLAMRLFQRRRLWLDTARAD